MPAFRVRLFQSVIVLAFIGAQTSVQAQKPPASRRQPVTPELERSAFADPTARALLQRARIARLALDSALRAYDAKTFLRVSIGIGIRKLGRDRLTFRSEQSARVRWTRESGILVEPTGRRSAAQSGNVMVDLTASTPIPYYPGREALWIPGGVGITQVEVNENEMIHPLATGGEAYYHYATGDSVTFRLPDGKTVKLRELRIAARRPDWHGFVGSFWFDVDRGSLVRAAYRMAAPIDIGQSMVEAGRRELAMWEERARTDTGAAALAARRAADDLRRGERGMIPWNAAFSPAYANFRSITVEYELVEGRFWLPRLNVAEFQGETPSLRLPIKVEESFRYNSVNVVDVAPIVPVIAPSSAQDDTTAIPPPLICISLSERCSDTSAARRAATDRPTIHADSIRVDSLRALAATARAAGDTARARTLSADADWYAVRIRLLARRLEGCARDSTYNAGTVSRFGGAVRTVVRMPCDLSRLATSPDLPGSIYDPGEELFSPANRDALLEALDLSLQAGWGPRRPSLHSGFDLLRYNRIEGASLGMSATSVLGLGYSAAAVARIGTADRVPNGELSLSRSNGRAEQRVRVFHRFAVANDDWGSPLSFGASLGNALYARDEGFYFRAWGLDLTSTRRTPDAIGDATNVLWRLFAERQRSAGREPKTQGSLANIVGTTHFEQNIDARSLTTLGAGATLARSAGELAHGNRLDTRLRAEGAFVTGDSRTPAYGRLLLDGTAVHDLGYLTGALSAAAGASAGNLPLQRAFFVGGLQTVRGLTAKPDGDGRVGDALWLARAEIAAGVVAVRPSVFYDIGWAGRRADFAHASRALSGAGVGLSILDGLIRVDVARGIWPERRWRTDFQLDARF